MRKLFAWLGILCGACGSDPKPTAAAAGQYQVIVQAGESSLLGA